MLQLLRRWICSQFSFFFRPRATNDSQQYHPKKMVSFTSDFTDGSCMRSFYEFFFLFDYLILFLTVPYYYTADVCSLRIDFRFSVPWLHAIMFIMYCCVGANIGSQLTSICFPKAFYSLSIYSRSWKRLFFPFNPSSGQ